MTILAIMIGLLIILAVLVWLLSEDRHDLAEQLDARTAELNDTRTYMAVMSKELSEAHSKVYDLTYGNKPVAQTLAKPKAKRKSAK